MLAVLLVGVTVFFFGAGLAQSSPSHQSVSPPASSQAELRHEQRTYSIPFGIEERANPFLPLGQMRIAQYGTNGSGIRTYDVTYVDGNESDRRLVSDIVTTAPVAQIIDKGTYVAPTSSTGSGYYNTDGNYVPSPSSSPAGASALCADGSYSYSQHRSGTCSHHGGVSEWY